MQARRETLTVETLCELALPSETKCLGGQAGMERAVEWATSLRATFPLFGRLERGYLALADLGLARRVEPGITVPQLLRELARVEAAGLIINEDADPQASETADMLHLPLLSVPEETDLGALERDLLHALLDREAHLARRREAIRREMGRAFSHGGLEALLARLREIVGAEARISTSEESTSKDTTIFAIRVAGRRLGQLVLALPEEDLSSVQRIYAEEGAELCGIEMLERRTRATAREASAQELLETLAEGGEAARMALARRGYALGEGRYHVALAFDGPSPDQDSGRGSAAEELRWITQHTPADVLTITLPMHQLALCSLPKDLPHRRLEEWLEQALQRAGAARQPAVGLSRPVAAVDQIPAAVEQACVACRLGQRIRGAASPYRYTDLGLYRLLGQLSDREEVRRFHHEYLGDLVAYDAKHNTELVLTLEAYFQHHGNISETADALYVHRNTLSYRLQRVAEITGLALSDPESRLNLQVALKIHRLSEP